MIRNLLAGTGVLALALVSAATLQAQGYFDDYFDQGDRDYDDGRPRVAVPTADLDLANPAGMDRLERRLNAAIGRVCPDNGARSLDETAAVRRCREDAVAGIRPQVDRLVAAAEQRDRYAYRAPGRWDRFDARPEPEPEARHAPMQPHGRDDRFDDIRGRDRYDGPRTPFPSVRPAPLVTPQTTAPPPGARLVKRTVTTTTTTTTARRGEAPPPPNQVIKRIIIRETPAPAASKWRSGRSAAFARRPLVANSWLPPVAWAASERATLRSFRTGTLSRWSLTDRDGIARSGYVGVSPARWIGGNACRNVQVVKYQGARQIVVASGMRCLVGSRLVNRAL